MTTMAIAVAVRHRRTAQINPMTLILSAAAVLTALHFSLAGAVRLTNDEAYYRLWSFHPALSYYDHPPMVAWFIAIGRGLAGDTEFGLRFLTPVCWIVTGAAMLRTAALLYDRATAMIAAAFVMVMPLMSVGAINISPDVPSVLFYVLGVWALAELDRSQDGRWWLILGVCAGLGLLSKYTNLFLGAAILVWLAAIPANRKWFGSPYLWLGGAIAAIIATPVVIWNAKHDWASFAFQFGRVVRASPKHTFHGLEMLGTFVALASPVIAFLSLYGLVVVMRRALATRTAGDVILSGATAPLLIYFCVHVLHNQVNGNWLAPIYPFLAICAARALEASRLTAWRTPLLHGGLAIGVLFSAVIYQHALTPLTGSRADPLEQLRGWDEFSQAIDQIRQRHGAAWIATGDFCTNAQLAFALKNGVATAQVNERIRYVDGPPLSPQMRDETAIYVEPAKGADESVVHGAFDHVVALDAVTRATGKPGGTRYNVYLVTGLGPVDRD